MSVPVGAAMDPASLEVNRNGALSPGQRSSASAAERSWRGGALAFAGIAAVIGVLILISDGGNYPQLVRYAVGGVALAIAAVLVAVRIMPNSNPLARDLHEGRVEVVEGTLGKRTVSGRQTTFHYFDLGNRSFEVWLKAYEDVPEGAVMRLFVLPRSKRVVNFERLPDRALPAGATDSPMAAMEAIAAGMRSHTRGERLEARATMTALQDALLGSATPPPAGERDPRPLAEAIVGSWQWAGAHVTFAGDGTATLALPNGRTTQGRWSVSGDSGLHVTGAGQDIAGDAWVAGDTLTVAQEGGAVRLHRAG